MLHIIAAHAVGCPEVVGLLPTWFYRPTGPTSGPRRADTIQAVLPSTSRPEAQVRPDKPA